MRLDFSPRKFTEDYRYRKGFFKYFKENIFLDTFAFCLIIQGKFDEGYNYNTLAGDRHNSYFMNVDSYRKLMDLLSHCKNAKLIITPAVINEGLRHIFEAIENKYSIHKDKKIIEENFVKFLRDEINMFDEKQPSIIEIINHRWIDEIKHHKLRDRLEIGELSIFVESDRITKCKAIITKDEFKRNKQGETCKIKDALIVQLTAFI
jgi:hypothetical protein